MTGAKIHIVDDDQLVRSTLAALAEAAGHCPRTHASAEALLVALEDDDAACVVTDVKMPGMGGLELLRRLIERRAATPVIVITGYGDVPLAVKALKSGAADFLEKPFDGEAFLECLAGALERADNGAGRRQAAAADASRHARLTSREQEVMALIVQGLSNVQAAARLGISARTVESHRARVMDKMEAATLSDLIRMAVRLEDS